MFPADISISFYQQNAPEKVICKIAAIRLSLSVLKKLFQFIEHHRTFIALNSNNHILRTIGSLGQIKGFEMMPSVLSTLHHTACFLWKIPMLESMACLQAFHFTVFLQQTSIPQYPLFEEIASAKFHLIQGAKYDKILCHSVSVNCYDYQSIALHVEYSYLICLFIQYHCDILRKNEVNFISARWRSLFFPCFFSRS